MVGLFLVFLSYILIEISSEIKGIILNIGLKMLSLALGLFMMFSIVNLFTEVQNAPKSETVMIVNEDGTVTEENGYYVDDDGNYYIRTDDWKKTILLAPFMGIEFEKVNPPIFDTNNLVTEEINDKEK